MKKIHIKMNVIFCALGMLLDDYSHSLLKCLKKITNTAVVVESITVLAFKDVKFKQNK